MNKPMRNAVIFDLYERGLTFGQIAQKLGVSRGVVGGIIRRIRLAEGEPARRPEKAFCTSRPGNGGRNRIALAA